MKFGMNEQQGKPLCVDMYITAILKLVMITLDTGDKWGQDNPLLLFFCRPSIKACPPAKLVSYVGWRGRELWCVISWRLWTSVKST